MFFFKQKTAYEMRISDWSSDVCSSDLLLAEIRRQQQLSQGIVDGQTAISTGRTLTRPSENALAWVQVSDIGRAQAQQAAWQRSDEHTSELQSLMRISYAVYCVKQKKQ